MSGRALVTQPAVPRRLDVDTILRSLEDALRRAGVQRDDPTMPLFDVIAHIVRFADERSGISDQVLREATQRIADALAASESAAKAETARFKAELRAVEGATIQRISHEIAASADKALTARVRLLSWWTFLASVFLFGSAIACAYILGDWRGSARAYAGIHETEQHLTDAFAEGTVGADIWWILMRANSNITRAIEACHEPENRLPTARGRACRVPLWLEPPDDPPVQVQTVQPLPQRDAHPAPAPTPQSDFQPINPFGILPLPRPGVMHYGP